MNKETLEEAALRLYPKYSGDPYNPSEDLNMEDRNIFTNGAKWQQEQNNAKYTEEEVIEYTIYVLLNGLITPKMWFEQFKKK